MRHVCPGCQYVSYLDATENYVLELKKEDAKTNTPNLLALQQKVDAMWILLEGGEKKDDRLENLEKRLAKITKCLYAFSTEIEDAIE